MTQQPNVQSFQSQSGEQSQLSSEQSSQMVESFSVDSYYEQTNRTIPIDEICRLKIERIIDKIWKTKEKPVGHPSDISEDDINLVISTVTEIYKVQPALLQLRAPITIVGDVHGQLHDVFRLFDLAESPPKANYLFLGDYVDRGYEGIETVVLIMCYKILYQNSVWMLRGNHECCYINRIYGFYEQCQMRFNIELWDRFSECFKWLPIAAIIDEKIFCIHGGISPQLETLDQIRNIPRPIEVPEDGLLCDLLWADPDASTNRWGPNERGTSYCYGQEVVDEFLKKFNFDLICRAHQAVMDGFEFPFPNTQCLVTIFSSPNYCYEYDNSGAILHVDKELFCSFTILKPVPWEIDLSYFNTRPGTPPRAP